MINADYIPVLCLRALADKLSKRSMKNYLKNAALYIQQREQEAGNFENNMLQTANCSKKLIKQMRRSVKAEVELLHCSINLLKRWTEDNGTPCCLRQAMKAYEQAETLWKNRIKALTDLFQSANPPYAYA